jgi:pimeloyl-ACP methyl ester carboxylesterase
MHAPPIALDLTLRKLAVLLGLAAAIPLRSGDLDSHPFPAANYRAAVARVGIQQAEDDRVAAPGGRSILLTHGGRTARVDVMLHGFSDSPLQFAALADSLFAEGDNVYVPRLPRHAERSENASELARLKAVELRRAADSAVDIASALGDTLTVVGLSMGGTMAGWMGQHRPEVHRVVMIAPAFAAGRVPSRLEKYLLNLTERLPNVTRHGSPDSTRPDLTPGFATHGLAEVLRLGAAVGRAADGAAPTAPELTLLLNERDRTIKSSTALRLARDWATHGAHVSVYTFPASLRLPHNVFEGPDTMGQPAIVYRTVLALIRGAEPGVPLRGCDWTRAARGDCKDRD